MIGKIHQFMHFKYKGKIHLIYVLKCKTQSKLSYLLKFLRKISTLFLDQNIFMDYKKMYLYY